MSLNPVNCLTQLTNMKSSINDFINEDESIWTNLTKNNYEIVVLFISEPIKLKCTQALVYRKVFIFITRVNLL